MNDASLETKSNSNGAIQNRKVPAVSSKRSASLRKKQALPGQKQVLPGQKQALPGQKQVLPGQKQALPGRKLTESVVRSSSGMDDGFTSDLLEPICKRMRDESGEPAKLLVDQVPPAKTFVARAFTCFLSSIALAVSSSFILLLALFSFGWMQSRCEFLHNLKYDVHKFRQNFSDTIIGQPYAFTLIPSVLADFQVEKFDEARVVWCVGWTGVGKSKSLDLLKHLADHSSVHYILPPLLPDTNEGLQEYTFKTIMDMNPCLKNIVIVDGWDEKYDNTTMKFISGFLSGVKEKAKEISHLNQLLLLISGTRSGEVINQEYLARRHRGEKRNEIPASIFVDIISKTREFSLIKTLGPLTIVPFLPMEVEHVAECAKREIIRFKKFTYHSSNLLAEEMVGNASQDSLLRRLLEHLPLLPSQSLTIPATGCKKVTSALTLLIQSEELAPG